jgi:hypothetical protein
MLFDIIFGVFDVRAVQVINLFIMLFIKNVEVS